MKTLTLILLITGAIFRYATCQIYSVDASHSQLTILGTSTLHDWEIQANNIDGQASINKQGDLSITSLSFNVTVKGLKSGKSAMDNNTYKALNESNYPEIIYRVTKVEVSNQVGESYTLKTTGGLTVAGVTRPITMVVKAKYGLNEISFEGQIAFKMTHFGVDPPTALLGTVKTGDDITIKFNVNYKK